MCDVANLDVDMNMDMEAQRQEQGSEQRGDQNVGWIREWNDVNKNVEG